MLREVFAQTGANSRVLETDGVDMQNRDHDCYFSAAHAAKDSHIATGARRGRRPRTPARDRDRRAVRPHGHARDRRTRQVRRRRIDVQGSSRLGSIAQTPRSHSALTRSSLMAKVDPPHQFRYRGSARRDPPSPPVGEVDARPMPACCPKTTTPAAPDFDQMTINDARARSRHA